MESEESSVDVKSGSSMFVYHKSQSAIINLSNVTHMYRGSLGASYYIKFFIKHKDYGTLEWHFNESNGGQEERDRVLIKIQKLYGESLS